MNISRLGRRCIFALMLCVVTWGGGCSNSDDPVVIEDRDFDAVLNATGGFEDVVEVNEVAVEDPVLDSVNSQDYFCTTTHYDINHMPDDYPLYNPNSGVLFPGNLLQGATLDQNTPESVVVARGPGDVTMTILNGSPSVTRHVDEVTLASMMQAQNEIIATAVDTVPARFTFISEEVHSKDQLAMYLDVEVGNFVQQFGASLDVNWSESYNRFVVKLNQSFFDMVFTPPNQTADFFGPNVTAADLARFTGPGNPPCYISQVTYGRIFYLVIESTSSVLDIRTAIRYSCDAAVANVAMQAGAQYIGELENVNIRAFALGGDAAMSIMAITSDFNELKDYLARGGGIRTGAPISYVVCDVANPSRVVNMAIAANFDVVNCIPVGESYENPFFWFRADQNIDLDASNHVLEWRNYIDEPAGMAARPDLPDFTSAGDWAANDANGHACVTFGPPVAGEQCGGRLKFPGVTFSDDTDWTVVAAIRLRDNSPTFPAYFIFGDRTEDRYRLELGFRSPTRMTMTTGDQQLDAVVAVPLDEFNVYTFRFSRDAGMSIYVNLDIEPAAVDPALTARLLGFMGASVGSCNGTELQIADLRAFGFAVNPAQRLCLVKEMFNYYGY